MQKPIPWHMDGIMRHATSGPLSHSLSRFFISGVMPPAADHLNNGGKLEEPTQRDIEEGIEEERGEINENGGGRYKDACSPARR